MNRLYFMPVIPFDAGRRRPAWFQMYPNIPGAHPDANPNAIPLPSGGVGVKDYGVYGLQNACLTYARGITQVDHDFLALQADVYVVPEDIDTGVAGVQATRNYFEAMNVPGQWITPANSYRDLLRQFGSMFQFSQRYYGRWGEVFTARVDMDTQFRNWPADVQDNFLLTVSDFGIDPALINQNSTLRQMLMMARDALAGRELDVGGFVF